MISSNIIVAKLASDYGVESDAYETNIKIWLYDALNILQCDYKYMGKYSKAMTIADYYITLPCGIDNVSALEYGDFRVLVNDSVINFSNGFYLGKLGYCYPSGNRYYFPMETGNITLHYRDYLKDKNGWPCLPKEEKLLAFLTLYCLQRMIIRGYKHQVLSIGDVVQLTEKQQQIASNALKAFGEEDHREFAAMLVKLAPDITLPDNYYLVTDSNYNATPNDYFLSQIDRLVE